MTTLGNLGSAETNWNFGNSFSSTINLFCNDGDMDTIKILGQGKSDGSSTCSDDGEDLSVDENWDYNKFSDSDKSNVDSAFESQCKNKETWEFDLNSISFPSSCSGSAYVKIECKSDEIIGLEKSTISLILVILDILGIYAFWFWIQRHGKFEYKEEEEIYGAVLNGSDFTVLIKGISDIEDPRVTKSKLWEFLENLLKNHEDEYVRLENDPNAHKIADINFGMSDYGVMHFYLERTQLKKQEAILAIKTNIVKDTDMKKKAKEKIKELRETNWKGSKEEGKEWNWIQ